MLADASLPKEDGRPATGRPFVIVCARPRNAVISDRVTRNECNFSFAVTPPVMKPAKAPIRTEAMIATTIGSPLFMIIAPDTEQRATREPTLRSMLPLMMIIVIPIATID